MRSGDRNSQRPQGTDPTSNQQAALFAWWRGIPISGTGLTPNSFPESRNGDLRLKCHVFLRVHGGNSKNKAPPDLPILSPHYHGASMLLAPHKTELASWAADDVASPPPVSWPPAAPIFAPPPFLPLSSSSFPKRKSSIAQSMLRCPPSKGEAAASRC
jgi:hypothetical protein